MATAWMLRYRCSSRKLFTNAANSAPGNADLEEEIKQLRAAVSIYRDVVNDLLAERRQGHDRKRDGS